METLTYKHTVVQSELWKRQRKCHVHSKYHRWNSMISDNVDREDMEDVPLVGNGCHRIKRVNCTVCLVSLDSFFNCLLLSFWFGVFVPVCFSGDSGDRLTWSTENNTFHVSTQFHLNTCVCTRSLSLHAYQACRWAKESKSLILYRNVRQRCLDERLRRKYVFDMMTGFGHIT